jgi:hypothetical protein
MDKRSIHFITSKSEPQKEGSAICGASCQHSGESTLGISKFSRSRKSGHFKSRNSESGSETSICGDAWIRLSARRYFGASEFDIS